MVADTKNSRVNETGPKRGARQTRTSLDREQRQLLSRKISDLGLAIQGTRLEPLIAQLYLELEDAGISFRPGMYLSDEWGCPSGIPVIGIPFYLVDLRLCSLEDQMTGIEAETDAEVSTYLRHEAGHAFNYAYRLYAKPDWRATFGRFADPYREDYRPIPFSTRFVRHIPAWYAQKHPDDDFAETFAVWLTPGSTWQETYPNTPAMAKLTYVDRAARKYGQLPPVVGVTRLDTPVQEMLMTLDSWYRTRRESYEARLSLPRTLDNDLRCLFLADKGLPAVDLLLANRRTLIRDVNSWTGVDRHMIAGIVNELTERVKSLDLKTEHPQEATELARVSVFLTTLAMNYLYQGQFVQA